MWRQWRVSMRDVVELILLPALAAVLPWPVCFRLFGWLARWDWLYRDATQKAIAQASPGGWLGADEFEWARRRRLVTLIDHADFYLMHTRSAAWLKRHVQVQGVWPSGQGPALLCTFHWGASMWALRHARMAGVRAHFVLASTDKAFFKGRPVLHAYVSARTAQCSAELGTVILDASSSLRASFSKILTNREQIMAVIDVPADTVSVRQTVTLVGRQAQVPNGLMRLAVDQQLPVALFLTGIDFDTGQRTLTIQHLGVFASVDALAARSFACLDEAIRNSPPSWHFWSEAPRFFELDQP
jgi:lauroyl/myristoyl acyltransferase